MTWNSLSEFLSMGGYGFYVWGSFGACALLMAVEPAMARWRHRAAVHRIRQESLALESEKEVS